MARIVEAIDSSGVSLTHGATGWCAVARTYLVKRQVRSYFSGSSLPISTSSLLT
jgi:hypothetical protein